MNQIPQLSRMTSEDFKGFISLRAVFNALSKYKDKGIFETGDRRYRLEAAEQEEVVRALGRSKEMAELISADDIGATTDVLDRIIIAGFQEFLNEPEVDLGQIFVKRPVDDFVFKTILYSALENYSPRKDQEGYDAAFLDVDDVDHSLNFWGKLVHVSWKAWKSNRGEILRTLPNQLGIAGKRTLQRIYAEQIGSDANRALMYTLGNGNLFTLPLTLANLETVMAQMMLLTDPMTNEPRGTKMFTLVVPATLKPAADRIVKPILDSLALASIAGNWRPTGIDKVIGNPMLDRYTTTGWWLFARNIGQQGPVVDAFLRGSEAPEIFIQASDAQRISGGGTDVPGEQFRTDNISWKGRLCRSTYWLTDLSWMTAFSDPTS